MNMEKTRQICAIGENTSAKLLDCIIFSNNSTAGNASPSLKKSIR